MGQGDLYAERSADTQAVFHIDITVVVLYHLGYDGKAQTGAVSLRFGGEEGLENVRYDLRRMPVPVSETRKRTSSPSELVEMVKVPPRSFMASKALRTRFRRIWES